MQRVSAWHLTPQKGHQGRGFRPKLKSKLSPRGGAFDQLCCQIPRSCVLLGGLTIDSRFFSKIASIFKKVLHLKDLNLYLECTDVSFNPKIKKVTHRQTVRQSDYCNPLRAYMLREHLKLELDDTMGVQSGGTQNDSIFHVLNGSGIAEF